MESLDELRKYLNLGIEYFETDFLVECYGIFNSIKKCILIKNPDEEEEEEY